MKKALALVAFIPFVALADIQATATSNQSALAGASNMGNAQQITFNSPAETKYNGSYSVKTTGAAILPGFAGSFSSDYCGATAGAAGGGMGFAFSVGAPKIDNSCVLLRSFERTMQVASVHPDLKTGLKILDAGLEILAEVDPKVRAIFERKGLVPVTEQSPREFIIQP